jgi:hypothetical protein
MMCQVFENALSKNRGEPLDVTLMKNQRGHQIHRRTNGSDQQTLDASSLSNLADAIRIEISWADINGPDTPKVSKMLNGAQFDRRSKRLIKGIGQLTRSDSGLLKKLLLSKHLKHGEGSSACEGVSRVGVRVQKSAPNIRVVESLKHSGLSEHQGEW